MMARGVTAALVLAVVSSLAVGAALLRGREEGEKATLIGSVVSSDLQLVNEEAASLRKTIAAAEGSPVAVASLFGATAGPQFDVDNVPLADVGAPKAPADPAQVYMAQAQAQLLTAQQSAARAAKLHAAEVEEAGLKKKVRKERAEYLRIALKERAAKGEQEVKQILRRQAHVEHVERERRRQREAQAEVRKARRWVKHQQQVRERVEGKLGMREVEEGDEASVLSPLSGGDEAVKTTHPLFLGHTSFQSAENMGPMWGRTGKGKIQPEQKVGPVRVSAMSIWKTLTNR
jgi:hypothetical protein